MKRLLLFLLLLPIIASAQTVTISTANGNWSATGTWVGGVVPGDGAYVVIKHNVVIDQNVGTSGGGGINWIRIELGILSCSNAAARTITFHSTGTDPVGSGTYQNPGADATTVGIFLSKGTFDCEGSATYPVTITSANGTSPVYVAHHSGDFIGCTTITANVCNGSTQTNTAYTTIKYGVLGPVVGTATTNYEGITHQFNGGAGTLDIENSTLTGLNRITVQGTPNAAGVTINNNSFLNSTNQYTIYAASAQATSGAFTITNNKETGATATGYLMYFLANAQGVTFTGNEELGTSSITRGLYSATAGTYGGETITGNFCFNPANASLPATGVCISSSTALTDTTSVINNNVVSGGYDAINIGRGSYTISGNWILAHSDAHASQGPIIVYGSSGQTSPNTVTVQNNISILDGNGTGNNLDCLFFTTSASSPNFQQYQINQNTFAEYAGNVGVYHTEGVNTVTQAIQQSYSTNNIVTNGAYGIVDGNSHSTWNSSYYFQSAGVHHNLTYGQTTLAYQQNGSSWSTGFDNGSTHHPNVLYGDVIVNPYYLNASATPLTFDSSSYCNGPGTAADLFTNTSPSCSIANMLAWLQFGFTPMNSQLKNAGACTTSFTPCDIGAVPVYPATAQAVM